MTEDPDNIKIKVTVKKVVDGVETDADEELTYDEAVEYAASLNTNIGAIETKWTEDNADGEAYAKIMNEFVVELQNATNSANEAIDELDGLEAPVDGVTGFPATYTGVYNKTLKKVAKDKSVG